MIVKDRAATIERAQDLSREILEFTRKKICDMSFDNDDDPAEHIYLSVCVMSFFVSRLIINIEGFGMTYGIENMTSEKIMEWVNEMITSTIGLNKKKPLHD